MRYTSALTVLEYMRENYGRRQSISEICRGVDLSYQPTHFHIKELEAAGVLCTVKAGRQSICQFINTTSTALWLGMLCNSQTSAADGIVGELTERLAPYIRRHYSAFDCIAVLAGENRLIAVPKTANQQPSESIVARCAIISGVLQAEVFSASEFMDHFETPSGILWAQSATIIKGHQEFWHYALTVGEGLGLVLPPSHPSHN